MDRGEDVRSECSETDVACSVIGTCIGDVECCATLVGMEVTGIATVDVEAECGGCFVVPAIDENEATDSDVVCVCVSGVIIDASDVECVGAFDVGWVNGTDMPGFVVVGFEIDEVW